MKEAGNYVRGKHLRRENSQYRGGQFWDICGPTARPVELKQSEPGRGWSEIDSESY